MDTAEKLIAIAENEKKVYDAGKDYAYDNPQTPTDSRTSMSLWYQYLNVDERWESYPEWDDENDEEYEYCPEDDESMWYESIEYPKGTQNIEDFSYFAYIQRFSDFNWQLETICVPTRKFTGVLDMSNAKRLSPFMSASRALEDAGTIIFPNSPETNIQNMFSYLRRLEKVRVEGTIYTSFNVQWSPLNLESAISVINALKDYSGTATEGTMSVTFSSTTRAILDNAGAIFDGLNWQDYLLSIGWSY